MALVAILALGPVVAACQTEPGYSRSYAWDDSGYYPGYSGYSSYSDYGYYDRDRSDYWRYRRRDWDGRRDDDWRDRGDSGPRRVDRNRDHDNSSNSNDARRAWNNFVRPHQDSNSGGGHQDNRSNVVIPPQSGNNRGGGSGGWPPGWQSH